MFLALWFRAETGEHYKVGCTSSTHCNLAPTLCPGGGQHRVLFTEMLQVASFAIGYKEQEGETANTFLK